MSPKTPYSGTNGPSSVICRKHLHDDALISGKLRQPGRYCFLADVVESRNITLFCSDFRIRAYFRHYYGETRFSKAFLHNIARIMLLQLDLSRNSHEICSSNTPLGESLYLESSHGFHIPWKSCISRLYFDCFVGKSCKLANGN